MSICLTAEERKIAGKIAAIKRKSGSHSPSPAMLTGMDGVAVKHDFCYLGNPYATDLFLKYFRKDFRKSREKLRRLVELYPSQNRTLAEKMGKMLRISGKHIFVGNGATEAIQAVLHNFSEKKILVSVPTFSPYIEFAPKRVKTVFHRLEKESDFCLDTDAFLVRAKREKADTVVIVNPNNPDGGYIAAQKLRIFLEKLRGVKTVIVDESFVHFSGTNVQVFRGASDLITTFPNLIVIKSLSKDFGIAGLRLGYAVMSTERVSALLERGYLWNVSGFGEYFLTLLGRKDFMTAYEKARLRAIGERDEFFEELTKIKKLRVYPSRGNFFLVELMDGSKADDLMVRLLVRYGIYIRPCGDKVGLKGEFVRIASRKAKENRKLAQALKEVLSE